MLSMERGLPQPIAPDALPVWVAALLSSEAGARVRWEWVGGRAVHTNFAVEPEIIEPLGIELRGGESVVVTWQPGETGYTIELQPQDSLAA
jgi:hypothetical protein